MAVLVDVGERNWPVQDNTFPFTVEAGATRLVLTLTHPDWPEGEVIRIFVTWPTGDTGQFSTGGGPVVDKAGNPTGGLAVLTWSCWKPPGVTTGTAHVEVMQALRSAVLVESF